MSTPSKAEELKKNPNLFLKNLWGKQDLKERGWHGRIKAVCRSSSPVGKVLMRTDWRNNQLL
jgi:hypothetical protein